MWNLKNKQTKNKLIDTENRLVVARDGMWEMGKMDEGGQKVHTSSYKTNKSWGCNIEHGDIVAKRVVLKSSHHKEKNVTCGLGC